MYAKSLIKAHGIGFVNKIIEEGFKIASEDPEIYSGLEEAPPDMAIEMIATWACNMSSEKIWPIIK